MLPGKVYKPEDIVQILGRRIWLLLVPFAVIAAGTAVYTRYLPDRFRSDTVIMVVPQRVPESYVRSTVSSRIEDRLNAISQQILSRSKLERIVQEFNLYGEERRTGIMEDIVQKMRTRDIKIRIQGGDSFQVSYEGENPRTVQKVTERLASLFIEENVRDRTAQADNTNQFLESRLDDARRRLQEAEVKVRQYREQYAGQLPSQLDSNTQALANSQQQINNLAESLNRDSDRRLAYETRLAELEDSVVPDAAVGVGTVQTPAQRELAAAQAALEDLRNRHLTDQHPSVRQAMNQIAKAQAKLDAEGAESPVSSETSGTRSVQISRLRAELTLLDKQMKEKQDELQRMRGQATRYMARVEGVPQRESEMTDLMRDYETINKTYNDLAMKREQSQLSAQLEQRQIGEQFRLLDAARIPERPFEPDRARMNLIGIMAGLGVGIALIALLEYKDATLKTDEEVTSVLNLPVLAVVPLLQSATERKRMFQKALILNLGCGATVAVCLAVVTYTFVR